MTLLEATNSQASRYKFSVTIFDEQMVYLDCVVISGRVGAWQALNNRAGH